MAIREKLIAPSLLLYLATFVNCSFDSGNTLEGTGLPIDAGVTIVDAEVSEDDANVNIADASPDATVIIPDAAVPSCVGDLLGFDILNMEDCDPTLPTGPLNLTMVGFRYLLNTTTQTLTRNGVPIPFTRTVVSQTAGPELLVVSAEGFSLGPMVTLSVVGERPLVLVSTASIELAGTLLVDADGALSGAGGDNTEDCEVSGRGGIGVVQIDDSGNQGGSGGGGGGFGGDGGEGAKIDEANNGNPTPEGFENGGDLIVPLRGGCSGGAGGGNGPGQGGGAGGAIQLVAKLQLQVSGTISAAGGGGRGTSQTNSGGGGGGSGGAILLQGSPVQLSGRLLVNGGGGGEGSRGGTGSGIGQDGSSQFITAAPGGAAGSSGSSSGGDGGAGGGAGVEGQNSVEINPEDGNEGSANMQSGAAGGGGGGGGVGRFRVVQS